MTGEVTASKPDAGTSRRNDVLLLGAVAAASFLLAFQLAIEKQLTALHVPGGRSFGYQALHADDAGLALVMWRAGARALQAFQPIDHRSLVVIRSGVAVGFIIAVVAVVALACRRWMPQRIAAVVVGMGLAAVSASVTVLLDLFVVSRDSLTENPYASWFTVLRWATAGGLVLAGAYLVVPLLRALRSRYAMFRRAPASARVTLVAAVAFAAIVNFGSIGAQVDDLVRRELLDRPAGWWNLVWLLIALAVYAVILAASTTIRPTTDSSPSAPGLVAAGAVLTAAGLIVLRSGGTSTLVVLGVILLTIGVLSVAVQRWSGPPLSRRRGRSWRVAFTLLAAAIAAAILGARFGERANPALLKGAVVILVVALLAGLRGWHTSAGRTGYKTDEHDPLLPEAWSAVVLLGIVVMGAAPRPTWALQAGLATAVLGAAGLLSSRQWYRPHKGRPDFVSWVLVGVGIAGVAMLSLESEVPPWVTAVGLPDKLAWPWAGALVVAGLVALRATQGPFVQVAWGPEPPTAEPVEGPATGVLVLSGVLPVAGLLIVSARVLGSRLASGTEGPPWQLMGLVAVLAVALVATGVVVATAAGLPPWSPVKRVRTFVEQRQNPLRRLAFAGVLTMALAFPLAALLSLAEERHGVAAEVGDRLGPVVTLIATLAWVAAVGAVVRWASRGAGRAAIFVTLGHPRTPVTALLAAWLLLTMVAGASFEDRTKSPHAVRLLRGSVPTAADCADNNGVLEVLEAHGMATSQVAEELCRWVDGVVAPSERPPNGVLTLVLVSASGGGVRAAAWTTRVLECLFWPALHDEPEDPCNRDAPKGRVPAERGDRWELVFAAGGASGGSVGIATAVAEALAPLRTRQDALGSWSRASAATEHVGPVAGQMLIGEMGLSALGLAPGHDRAEVLIDSWSAPFPDVVDGCRNSKGEEVTGPIESVGFLAIHAVCPEHVPLLLFNGTVVRTGGRFDISPFDQQGDVSVALRDFLCGDQEDIALFDAAFLSARFPFVTPSGRLGDETCEGEASPVDVVDGGYHENSGAAQIAQLWAELEPMLDVLNAEWRVGRIRIQPVFVQIENGELSARMDAKDQRASDCPFIGDGEAADVSGGTAPGDPEPDQASGGIAPGDSEPDQAVRFGEPLRVAWAGFLTRVRARADAGVRDALVEAMCADGIPVLTIALYEHPGRLLPLGWSLTDPVLDDMERVMALRPNACRARVLSVLAAGGTAVPLCPPTLPEVGR